MTGTIRVEVTVRARQDAEPIGPRPAVIDNGSRQADPEWRIYWLHMMESGPDDVLAQMRE